MAKGKKKDTNVKKPDSEPVLVVTNPPIPTIASPIPPSVRSIHRSDEPQHVNPNEFADAWGHKPQPSTQTSLRSSNIPAAVTSNTANNGWGSWGNQPGPPKGAHQHEDEEEYSSEEESEEAWGGGGGRGDSRADPDPWSVSAHQPSNKAPNATGWGGWGAEAAAQPPSSAWKAKSAPAPAPAAPPRPTAAATGWGIAPPSRHAPSAGWKGWSDEAMGYSHRTSGITAPPQNPSAMRNPVSPQEQSQILQSLLRQPSQGGNGYISQYQQHGQHTSPGPWGQPQHKPDKSRKKDKSKKQQTPDAWGDGYGNADDWGDNNPGWGHSGGGWGDEWGTIHEEDEEEYEDRHVRFSPSSNSQHDPERNRYSMPSKTMAHAARETTTSVTFGAPYNKLNEYTDVRFIESHGVAIEPVHGAIFGGQRPAKERIHWMFSPEKDERVSSLFQWIQDVSYSLGAFGLHKFLQTRERGALLVNAEYRPPENPSQGAFDWLTFDELQATRDKILQESVAFYNPAIHCIVFVFLPSKSGNSVAMWRRKVNVPNNTRLMLQAEIALALSALRREKDYLVHVDELPPGRRSLDGTMTGRKRISRRSSLPGGVDLLHYRDPKATKPKKKRKWWQFFRRD